MGFANKIVLVALCALWVGCASGGSGGDGDDAAPSDAAGGGAIDAAAPIPDAGAPLSTCEACTANHQCPDDHICATIGDTKACVESCSESDPSCPEGFMCGGIKMTFCAPLDGLCCIDGDDDTFGTGVDCAGPDCNDDDPDINPDADDVCNAVDDDCSPATDDGSTDPDIGVDCDGADTDLCEEGLTYCDTGAILCDDVTGDILDLCDGMDNDCNPATLDGADDPAFGMACDSPGDPDLCFDDQYICDSVAGMIVCQDLAGGAVDLCNGLDDDCDPATADGDGDPLVGVSCDGADADLCEEGFTLCTAGAVVCDDLTGDNLDLCNGLDDDCNLGTLDGVHDPDVGPLCDGFDTDLCEEGNFICTSGIILCTDTTSDSVEICNGLDDDCDTVIDDLVPDVVCPGQNPLADNVTSWGCAGMCEINSCSASFADIDALVTNGCECGDLDSFGKSCATATVVTVPTGGTVVVDGKLETASDADYIRFEFESTGGAGSPWHPRIQISVTTEYLMDALTTGCTEQLCAPDGVTNTEDGTPVDVWEQDYFRYTGTGTCCQDDTGRQSVVIVRIYRSGGPATCNPYTVTATHL